MLPWLSCMGVTLVQALLAESRIPMFPLFVLVLCISWGRLWQVLGLVMILMLRGFLISPLPRCLVT